MEQMEPIANTKRADLIPPMWDPAKAAKRQVRVIKVSHDLDPMKEQTIFEFGGFVYICYAKKTRGRSMIRCLGLADVERESSRMNPADANAAGEAMREAIDKDIIDNIAKEAEGDGGSRGPDQASDA